MKTIVFSLLSFFFLSFSVARAVTCELAGAPYQSSGIYSGELRSELGQIFKVISIFYCDEEGRANGSYFVPSPVTKTMRGVLIPVAYDEETRTLKLTILSTSGRSGSGTFVFSPDLSSFSGVSTGGPWTGVRQ